ncbi:WalW protein [Candidatus Vecturithrix granuli]|uniref:WalW protein n=1 Tax=Vecturithrix granuli TaxID=1499967 RepID=A0A081C4B6_VECG1|nr:WalW protein [Candidatus Vecturithrix granuli]
MSIAKGDKKCILFVLTVDTEEEWDWDKEFPTGTPAVQNIHRIPKFQSFCHELGIKPTYFIDYAVISDQSSRQYFQKPFEKGECELGSHLHTWVTPPIEESIHEKNTHAINLPSELVKRKLRTLTQKFEATFGVCPQVFRSGRWGVNGALLQMLIEEGYHIDSSVYPFYADSTFSYYEAPGIPYWPDLEICTHESSQKEIFEIPVTSGFNHPSFTRCHRIHQFLAKKPWNLIHGVGILWNLQLLRKLQLSPELTDIHDMITLIHACLKRGHQIIHMFLHSSSLLPGGSPYVRTEDDERKFYQSIADVVHYLKDQTDVSFCTLTEAKQHYLQEENA